MYLNEEFEKVQKEALAAILHCRKKKQKRIDNAQSVSFFKNLISNDEKVVGDTFGESGKKMKLFAEMADIDHPDLFVHVSKRIPDESISQACSEFLNVSNYANKENFSLVIPTVIYNVASKMLASSSQIKFMDDPTKTNCSLRFLKNKEDRHNVRQKKSTSSFSSLGVFDGNLNSLGGYVRNNKLNELDILKAKEKMTRYRKSNCSFLAREVGNSIEAFKQITVNRYYGFCPIKAIQAAAILSNVHGFSVSGSLPVVAMVTVKKSQFYKFHKNMEVNEVDCLARVYPLHDIQLMPSDNFKEVIKKLENWPEANDKPIFDHFLVLVPSIDVRQAFNSYDKSPFEVISYDGEPCVLDTHDDVQRFVDFELIKNKIVRPILLGEKDGECYFVCHWE